MPAMGRRPTVNTNLPPRMRRRVSSSGKAFYYYDTGGKPRREIPLGSDYVLAMREWARLEENGATPPAVTFAVVAERYRLEVMPGKAKRTQEDNARELAELLAFFNAPPAPLEAIRPVHVRQYLDRRKDAPVRANREKALLSHIWNKAREWGYTDKENPCRGVQGFTERGRDEYVEDDVYKAVWDAADAMVRDGMDLAYLTGQRVGDVLKMTETALRGGVLALQQGKTGKKLRIALSGDLGAVVARARERRPKGNGVRSLHLVVAEDGQPLTYSGFIQRFQDARAAAIRAAKKHGNAELAAGIARFQFRDLRAKAGTDKADSSGDVRQAQRQLGHSSVVMTEQYVRNRRGDKVDPTR